MVVFFREEEGVVGGFWFDTENCNFSKKCFCKSMFSFFYVFGLCFYFLVVVEKLIGKSFLCGNNYYKIRCRVIVEGVLFLF